MKLHICRNITPPCFRKGGYSNCSAVLAAAIGLLVFGATSVATAATQTWLTTGTTNWNTGTNWSGTGGAVVPGLGDTANITTDPGSAVVVNYSSPMAAASFGTLSLGYGDTNISGHTSTLNIAAAGFKTTGAETITAGGILNVNTGGVFNDASTLTLGNTTGSNSNLAIFTNNGGSVTVAGTTTANFGTMTLAAGTTTNSFGNITLNNASTLTVSGTATSALATLAGTAAIVTVNTGGSYTVSGVKFTNSAAGTTALNNAGTLQVNGSASQNSYGGTAGYTINLTAGTSTFTGGIVLGNNSSKIAISGGTNNIGSFTDTRDGSSGSGTANGLIITGGTTTASSISLGGSSWGNVNVSGTGSLSVSGAFVVGDTASVSTRGGGLTVSGGTLTSSDTNGLILLKSTLGANGNATFSGGTSSFKKITLVDSSVTSGTGATTLTVNGGTVYVDSGGIVSNAGLNGNTATATVTLGNAASSIVGATANWSSSVPMTLSGTGANAITFQAADAATVAHNISLSGLLSGAGGLKKTGAGTLTLSATNNTYTGDTTVSVGTMLANTAVSGTNSATGTGSVSVSNAAILGGTGQITPGSGKQISVLTGGFIAPGDGGIGTLTLNSANTAAAVLSLASGANLTFELNSTGPGDFQSDKIALVSGAANDIVFGGTNAINFTDLSGGTLAHGAYTLFTANIAGAYSGFGNLSIGTGLSVYTGSTLQVVGNDIVLNVVPEPATWALLAFSLTTVVVLRRRRNS